jgi:hypothetical protein
MGFFLFFFFFCHLKCVYLAEVSKAVKLIAVQYKRVIVVSPSKDSRSRRVSSSSARALSYIYTPNNNII